jgi:hypothetical protein
VVAVSVVVPGACTVLGLAISETLGGVVSVDTLTVTSRVEVPPMLVAVSR